MSRFSTVHEGVARQCDSFPDYLEAVCSLYHAQEVLDSILWHMDDDDKVNILEYALRELDFDVLNSDEFEEIQEGLSDSEFEERFGDSSC